VSKIDKQLAEANQLAMKVSSQGRAARSKAGIKVRQPLDHFVVSSEREKRVLKSVESLVLDELNVKEIKLETPEKLAELAKNDDYVVDDEAAPSTAIYTEITPELAAEGTAREVVHRLQTMRRSAGFDIADHIITYYQGDTYMKGIMEDEDLGGYIKQETLSDKIVEGIPEQDIFTERYKLGGSEVVLGVKKLD